MKLRPWLRGATTAMTLLLALWLCWQCIDIYVDGNAPKNLGADGLHLTDVYTAGDVAQRLQPLRWALMAYVVLILGATAAGKNEESKLPMPEENRLAMMKRLLPEGTSLPEAALKEERLRRWVRIALVAWLLVSAIPAGVFLLDGRNFVSWELETVMGALLRHVLPWTVEAIIAIWAAEMLCAHSMVQECALLKALPKGKLTPVQEKAFPVGAVRMVLLGIAMVFIVLGVMNGGLRDVLVKAINICTECIGLG